jgi:hypothetical protein
MSNSETLRMMLMQDFFESYRTPSDEELICSYIAAEREDTIFTVTERISLDIQPTEFDGLPFFVKAVLTRNRTHVNTFLKYYGFVSQHIRLALEAAAYIDDPDIFEQLYFAAKCIGASAIARHAVSFGSPNVLRRLFKINGGPTRNVKTLFTSAYGFILNPPKKRTVSFFLACSGEKNRRTWTTLKVAEVLNVCMYYMRSPDKYMNTKAWYDAEALRFLSPCDRFEETRVALEEYCGPKKATHVRQIIKRTLRAMNKGKKLEKKEAPVETRNPVPDSADETSWSSESEA